MSLISSTFPFKISNRVSHKHAMRRGSVRFLYRELYAHVPLGDRDFHTGASARRSGDLRPILNEFGTVLYIIISAKIRMF